jgi:glycosyltransferase involved in cell wall biosynthesis
MRSRGRGGGILYISYDGLAEPLGQSQVAPYLRHLAARGHRITLLTFEKPVDRADGARMATLAQTMAAAGIRWLPLTYHKRPSVAATAWDIAVGYVRGLTVCARERIQIVHARSYVAGLVAWLLTRTVAAKFLFDMRGFWPDERVEGALWPRGRLYRLVKRLESRFVRDADAIVTLTRRSCATLQEWMGDARIPVTVIPTCVDVDRYVGLRTSGVSPVAPVFVYAGSLGTWYAGDEIARFMEEVLRRFPSARLVVLTRNRAEAEAALARAPKVAQVTQVVTADPADVPSWLKSADAGLAFYTPGFSRQATCPTKAGEYLAMGLPVVVGVGVGDIDDVVTSYRVGAALAEYSAEAHREALERLVTLWADPDLGTRCREVAVRDFGLEGGVARYAEVYAALGAGTTRGSILILCPYPPGTGPSQRFRFEQYIATLVAHGFDVEQRAFWDEPTWRILYKPGHLLPKLRGLLAGFGRRLGDLARARRADYVFIHLEAAPVGPPLIEWMLFAMRKKIVYDIDDAIFIARTSRENWLASRLRFRSKVGFIAKHAYKVITVNAFLRDWARRYHPQATVVPTTIDPTYHRPLPEQRDPARRPVIGWTGTKSTMHYLDLVRPVLTRLAAMRDFDLLVIADDDPGFPELANYRFVPWRKETEIDDLMRIDIGLMPVPDDLWVRGKVGFKAIQYAALEIPAVVSDIGSGRDVVDDGITGRVVPNDEDAWVQALTELIDDPARRRRLGTAARDKILSYYATSAQADTYVRLFS